MVKDENITKNKETFFKQIGFCFFEDGLYGRLTVKDHFKFYKELYDADQTIDQILELTQLGAIKNSKVNSLSVSEKRRVHFSRLLFQDPALFLLEEPDLNTDIETKHVLINILKKLQQEGKAILVLTGNMESAITFADSVYRLDEDGLRQIELGGEEEGNSNEEVEPELENDEKEPETEPIQFNKIPTKVNEKIILFDPPEIDYIESSEGQSNIYIKGEPFPSLFTLNDLEKRLQHYGFFRCHRSYIVNLQKVREVITWTRNSYSLILEDKEKSTIPLSKTKMAKLKDMLGLK
ncbi:LytTR family transcriptional regulator DNA-binding domain-containing protein [Virgibacillus ainsalahensis]